MEAPTSNYGCGADNCVACYGDEEWRDSRLLERHETGDHSDCHPDDCEEAAEILTAEEERKYNA